jgi:hypothetical protein
MHEMLLEERVRHIPEIDICSNCGEKRVIEGKCRHCSKPFCWTCFVLGHEKL